MSAEACIHQEFPFRRRRYWADSVGFDGKKVIRATQAENSKTYNLYAEGGYYPVADIAQQTRGIFNYLKPYQRRIAMVWAAQELIAKLEEEDVHEGISREYVSIDGAVRPRRGRKWKEIAKAEHVFWQPEGVTILARDILRPSRGDREAAAFGLPFQYYEKATVMAYTDGV